MLKLFSYLPACFIALLTLLEMDPSQLLTFTSPEPLDGRHSQKAVWKKKWTESLVPRVWVLAGVPAGVPTECMSSIKGSRVSTSASYVLSRSGCKNKAEQRCYELANQRLLLMSILMAARRRAAAELVIRGQPACFSPRRQR